MNTEIDYRNQRRPVVLGALAETPRLPAIPNYPFLLRHNPRQVAFSTITVDGKPVGYWLPKIKPFTLLAGTNKIKLGPGKSGRPDYRHAKVDAEAEGWVFLEPTETWRGEQVLTEYDCRHPKTKQDGVFYCTVFDRPSPGDGGADAIVDFNHEEHARWVHSLVLAGKLPVPKARACAEQLRQAEDRLKRLGKGTHGNNEVVSAYSVQLARVTAMKAAIVPGDKDDPLATSSTVRPSDDGPVRRSVAAAELATGTLEASPAPAAEPAPEKGRARRA